CESRSSPVISPVFSKLGKSGALFCTRMMWWSSIQK
ncbi:MAG: hypothetical protein ACI9NQ_001673, partial [Paracoccaceae bacterium]